MRIDVREDRSGCDVVWYNDTMISQSLPRLSTATGLLYFYTFKKQQPGDFFGGWYLTAVDFDTSEELWDRLISPGTGSIIDPLSERHRTRRDGTQRCCVRRDSHRRGDGQGPLAMTGGVWATAGRVSRGTGRLPY